MRKLRDDEKQTYTYETNKMRIFGGCYRLEAGL